MSSSFYFWTAADVMRRILFFLIPLLYISSAHALPECRGDITKRWDNCYGKKSYPPDDYFLGEWFNGERRAGVYVKKERLKASIKAVPNMHEVKNSGFDDGDDYLFISISGDFFRWRSRDTNLSEWLPITRWNEKRAEFLKVLHRLKVDVEHFSVAFEDLTGSRPGMGIPDAKEKIQGLPQCSGEYDQRTWRNCVGTYTFANGDKYVGEFKDGKSNGQGTYTRADGDKYVGEFKDNNYDGQGTYTYANGDKYVGEFKDNNYDGQGTFTFAYGEKYVGEFKDGKFNGQGTYTRADGETYVGEFRDDSYIGLEERRKAEEQRKEKSDDELLQASSGSAFAVSRDGYLVTNNHVINGCEQVAIHSDGVAIPVSIVTYDLQNDLALLKGQFSPTHVFPIRRSNPALLEDVYVAGFPFGEKYSSSIKVTKGIISALTGVGNNFSNFQIDAALQPGNSGGPILDENGNVIGVAVAKLDVKYALENWGALPENINFGIKSNVVMSVLESQRVNVVGENSTAIDKRKLGEQISVGTYYVSCWMTTAQIEQMREKKVMFENIK